MPSAAFKAKAVTRVTVMIRSHWNMTPQKSHLFQVRSWVQNSRHVESFQIVCVKLSVPVKHTRTGLRVGKEVRNICLFLCVYVCACSSESDLSPPTARGLIAILQHELYTEIGQQACFLSRWVRDNRTRMVACLNNCVFAGSRPGETKQQLGIDVRASHMPRKESGGQKP